MISPCIGNCKIKNAQCVGCGRSSDEITNWMFYSDAQRKEITQRLGDGRKDSSMERDS